LSSPILLLWLLPATTRPFIPFSKGVTFLKRDFFKISYFSIFFGRKILLIKQ
jgi:hypothetical protein